MPSLRPTGGEQKSGTFTDFVYLLLFLLSLYGFGIPLFQNSRMVGPGGFVSGFFVYNNPQAIYYQTRVCLSTRTMVGQAPPYSSE